MNNARRASWKSDSVELFVNRKTTTKSISFSRDNTDESLDVLCLTDSSVIGSMINFQILLSSTDWKTILIWCRKYVVTEFNKIWIIYTIFTLFATHCSELIVSTMKFTILFQCRNSNLNIIFMKYIFIPFTEWYSYQYKWYNIKTLNHELYYNSNSQNTNCYVDSCD